MLLVTEEQSRSVVIDTSKKMHDISVRQEMGFCFHCVKTAKGHNS